MQVQMSRDRLGRAIASAIVVLPSLLGVDADRRPSSESTVVEVIDGDTVVVRLGRRRRDRPAHRHRHARDANTRPSRSQCFGPEASDLHRRTCCPPGTDVRLERDVEARDHFGRLLAYVYRAGDGLFVNLELAAAGLRPTAGHRAQQRSRRTMSTGRGREARAEGRGLWAACGGSRDAPPKSAWSARSSRYLLRDIARRTARLRSRRPAADHQLRRPRLEPRRQRRASTRRCAAASPPAPR